MIENFPKKEGITELSKDENGSNLERPPPSILFLFLVTIVETNFKIS